MSDEALNAHLDWLDDCAKEQGEDYETWLEKRVAQLEAKKEQLLKEIDAGTTFLSTRIAQLEAELVVAWESDRAARVFNVEYLGRAQKAEAEIALKADYIKRLENSNAALIKRLWDYEHQASDERIRDEK